MGGRFVAMHFAGDADDATTRAFAAHFRSDAVPAANAAAPRIDPLLVVGRDAAPAPASGMPTIRDRDGLAAQRYDAAAGTTYLFRPDQHVCARWRRFDARALAHAMARATCNA